MIKVFLHDLFSSNNITNILFCWTVSVFLKKGKRRPKAKISTLLGPQNTKYIRG